MKTLIRRIVRWCRALWHEDRDAIWCAAAIWMPFLLLILFGGAHAV